MNLIRQHDIALLHHDERKMNSKKSYDDVQLPTNPNIPAWIITPKEEKVIFERWRRNAHIHCDELIRSYIECSNSYRNPLDGMKHCKQVNKDREDCLKLWKKIQTLDEMKDKYIDEKIEMRKMIDDYVKKRDSK